jgi:hypothetical protein
LGSSPRLRKSGSCACWGLFFAVKPILICREVNPSLLHTLEPSLVPIVGCTISQIGAILGVLAKIF